MMFYAFTALALLTSGAQAHFRLLHPEPRGPFVADLEPNFCGGYDNAVSNRSEFPLSGGFFTLQTNHGPFTAGVILSTEQNPSTFDAFNFANGSQQFARGFATEDDGGTYCIPLDIAAANIPGAVDGANVTIQIVFDGGDGSLYQCADLTLRSNFTTPSSVECKNATAEDDHDHADGEESGDGHSHGSGSMGRTHQFSFVAAALGMVAAAIVL
ncbi:hypothetical protein FA15DRAFT_688082 [Coprinopsis marcescibilis]|uniref:Copper acquisition factor BIM1-like domain-containing protein n=1 Tax=Coprinopsis marcescibilis TaxID=230819 RepID=A0A5C3KRL1_COPMA|nr:hypothetical protein FA15DRAFT_688082 [Coprinopsis marcescibilis]